MFHKLSVPDHILSYLKNNSNITSFSYSENEKEFNFKSEDLISLNGALIENKDDYPSSWTESSSIFEQEKYKLLDLKDNEYSILKFKFGSGDLYVFPILFGNGGFLTFNKNVKHVSRIIQKEEFFEFLEEYFDNYIFISKETKTYDEYSDPLEIVWRYYSFTELHRPKGRRF